EYCPQPSLRSRGRHLLRQGSLSMKRMPLRPGRLSVRAIVGVCLGLAGLVVLAMLGLLMWRGASMVREKKDDLIRQQEAIAQATEDGALEIRFRINGASFELVRIPAGEFDLGAPPTEAGYRDGESPVRRIRISKPFYLGRHEVTQLQYKEVMGS